MSRRKTPLSKARLTGADRKDPQRYRGRSEPGGGGPVGDPPDYLTQRQREAWRTFQRELPWLAKSDRAFLAVASILRARLMDDAANQPAAFWRELRATLSALGATPVDRQHIHWAPAEKDDDDWSQFTGEPM